MNLIRFPMLIFFYCMSIGFFVSSFFNHSLYNYRPGELCAIVGGPLRSQYIGYALVLVDEIPNIWHNPYTRYAEFLHYMKQNHPKQGRLYYGKICGQSYCVHESWIMPWSIWQQIMSH